MKFRVRFIVAFLFVSISSFLVSTSLLVVLMGALSLMIQIPSFWPSSSWWRSTLIDSGFLLSLWGFLSATIVCYFNPVTVDENGLSCSTFWGIKNRTAKWSSITHCKYLNTLGFKTLRIFYSDSRWALWLTLHLERNEEFMEAVKKYAGENSVLYSNLIKYNT